MSSIAPSASTPNLQQLENKYLNDKFEYALEQCREAEKAIRLAIQRRKMFLPLVIPLDYLHEDYRLRTAALDRVVTEIMRRQIP